LENEKRKLTGLQKRISEMQKTKNKFKTGNENKRLSIDKQITNLKKQVGPLKSRITAAETRQDKLDVKEIISEAYLRTLSRLPSEDEVAKCESYIHKDNNLINGVTGMMWALVNTKEFVVNH